MPIINTSFSGKPLQYNKSSAQTSGVSIPELNVPIVYANSDDTSLEKAKIYSDIIYADTSKAITPRDIFDQIKRRIPEVVGNCGIDDGVFIELLKTELALFTALGTHKWNFLTVRQTLQLQHGILEYALPSNYDQMIAVWFDRDCRFTGFDRKVEVIQVDTEKSNFVSGYNFYDITGGRIKFINSQLENSIENCNHCGHCNYCNNITGSVKLHYHITAPSPEQIDEEMQWFPANPMAIEYIKERLISAIYLRAGQSPYLSTNAETFFNGLMKWDSNYWPIANKRGNDTVLISYKNLHKRTL